MIGLKEDLKILLGWVKMDLHLHIHALSFSSGNEGEDAIHNPGTNLKALFVMGNENYFNCSNKKSKRGFR